MRARFSFILIVFVWLMVMHGVMSAQMNTGSATNSGNAVAVDITYTQPPVPPYMWTSTPHPYPTLTRTPYRTPYRP